MANSSDQPPENSGPAEDVLGKREIADEDELAKQKRSRRGGVAVPVIVVAGGSKIDDATEALNASPSGLFIACPHPTAIGTRVEVLLTALGEQEPVRIVGSVVRHSDDPVRGMGIEIDRKSTPANAMQRYRKLILDAIRHRPSDEGDSWAMPDTTLEDIPSLITPTTDPEPSEPDS